jgi:hypothetical protein
LATVDSIMITRRLSTSLLVIPVSLAALALAGCGSAPKSGTVVDKRHHSASTSYRRSCSGHGHSRHCRQVPVHHAAKWELDLKAGNGKTGWRKVSESDYNRYQIGQQYP